MKNFRWRTLVNIAAPISSLLISGCGPVFAVTNDTNKNVYVDFILDSAPREMAPQMLEHGGLISNPHCWKDAGTLYLGYAPRTLEKKAYAKLCNPSKCNCTVTMTQLETANR